MTDETKAHSPILQTLLSFEAYLDEFASRLTHQFKLTFPANPGRKPGFERIRLQTEVPNTELVAADEGYVPVVK